ncbi:MAG: hypothetical protein ACREIQ_02160, partial [Nitrospiria bacterium]
MPDKIKLKSRIDEEYIVQQYESATQSDTFRSWKNRLAEFKRVYRGDWTTKYADGTSKNIAPQIENMAHAAVHDIAGLASEARSSVIHVPDTEDDKGYKKAKIRDSAAETIWIKNNARRLERRTYMDMLGSGIAILACSYNSKSDYPTVTRLDPEFCYPDVHNGMIQDLVYLERAKLRDLQYRFPDFKGMADPYDQKEAELCELYTEKEVVRAVIQIQKGRGTAKGSPSAQIVERWEHKLSRVPVAFVQLDTLDGAFRGMFDQLEQPLISRNTIIQYMMDYIESMVHAPFEERGVLNAEDMPGMDTIYHHDTTEDNTFMRRVPPAAPAGAVFGISQMLQESAQGEAVQPPARQGQVQQSQASGTFVNSTQGRLTTVVEELQDLMADLRKQATYILFEIDEEWLDMKKLLTHPVSGQR